MSDNGKGFFILEPIWAKYLNISMYTFDNQGMLKHRESSNRLSLEHAAVASESLSSFKRKNNTMFSFPTVTSSKK